MSQYRLRRPFQRVLNLAVAYLLLCFGGCEGRRHDVVSVELIETGDAGNSERMLLISLGRDMPRSDLDAKRIKLRVAPPAELNPRIRIPDRDILRSFSIRIGAANLQAEGIFAGDPDSTSGPTGIGIDLGAGETWVDLLPRKTHPILQRAIWEDSTGNLAVDRGDHLRLLFNRPVAVAEDESAVLVPDHLYLTASDDRLGSTDEPARLTTSPDPHEVLVALGATPRLVPAHDFVPRSEGGFQPFPDSLLEPSGVTLHGTPLHPSSEIIDARSGLGAVSRHEIGIELPEDHPRFLPVPDRFPAGTPLESLSATTVFDDQILICGGMSEKRMAHGDVLLFDPLLDPGQQRIHEPMKLEFARYLHTATALPGPDGIMGNPDDFLVVVGGTDGRKSIGEIEIVRFSITAGFEVRTAAVPLAHARFNHAATALSGNRILVTGGVKQQEDATRIVGASEILSFEFGEQGKIEVRSTPHVLPVPRMAHTATRLDSGSVDAKFDDVLIFGGNGVPRWFFERENIGAKATYPFDLSYILGGPEILRIPRSATEDIQVIDIDMTNSYELIRHSHRALAVEPTEDGRARVLVSGGSLHAPWIGFLGQGRWDIQHFRPPQGDECATSWLFIVDADNPNTTQPIIVTSPTGETRIRHQLIEIPGLGALSIGGEPASDSETRAPLATGELFLSESPGGDPFSTVVPFSILLDSGRSGFAYASTSSAAGLSLFILGGRGATGRAEPLPDIEVLRLPAR